MHPFLELNHASVIQNACTILDNISLSIGISENVAILGPNGSGKSTLLRLIYGDLHPSFHEETPIKLFGQQHWELDGLRSKLAVVSQVIHDNYLIHPEWTGFDVVLSGYFGSIGIFADQKITSTMREHATSLATGLGLAYLLNQTIGTVSTGELGRLLIGRALIQNPQVIVLDEPTIALDIKSRAEFLNMIRQRINTKNSLILVTHLIEEIIPEIKRVILLKKGQIFADGEKPKVLNNQTLSEAFDTNVIVEQHNGYYYLKRA